MFNKKIDIMYGYDPRTPLAVKESILDIESKFDEEVVNNPIYAQCPAWSHKAKRTFVVRSPIPLDFSVEYDEKENIPLIRSASLKESFLKNYLILPNGWYGEKITLQITHLFKWFFWTKEKNVWMHLQPHPQSSISNFYYIEGWYNISSWNRGTSLAFNLIDKRFPVIIKRGDPLFQVSFYTQNLNNQINLIKTEVPEEVIVGSDKRISLKHYIPFIYKKYMFNNNLDTDKNTSKCPFKKLFER